MSGPLALMNHISGRNTPAKNGKTLPVTEPAVGGVLGHIPASDSRDVDEAVEAARAALREKIRRPNGPALAPMLVEGAW